MLTKKTSLEALKITKRNQNNAQKPKFLQNFGVRVHTFNLSATTQEFK